MDDSDNTQQLNEQDSRVLAHEVQTRNQDLTAEEAERLADEIPRQAIDNLVSPEKNPVRAGRLLSRKSRAGQE